MGIINRFRQYLTHRSKKAFDMKVLISELERGLPPTYIEDMAFDSELFSTLLTKRLVRSSNKYSLVTNLATFCNNRINGAVYVECEIGRIYWLDSTNPIYKTKGSIIGSQINVLELINIFHPDELPLGNFKLAIWRDWN